LAIVAKTYTDYCLAELQTWTEKITQPVKNYETYCREYSDFMVRNLDAGPTINPETLLANESDFEIEYVRKTVLHDWTTQTLVENASFTEFPEPGSAATNIYPRFWEPWVIPGPPLTVKQATNIFHTAPSSLWFEGSVACPICVTGIKQTVPIVDVLQTEGIYRLMFYYRSDDDNISIIPKITFYGDKTSTTYFPSLAVNDTGSSWKMYDEYVDINIGDNTIDEMELVIGISRKVSGAFNFYIDDVDFHYAFDITTAPNKPPGFPSATLRRIQNKFSCTTDQAGHKTILGDGIPKYKGSFDFYLIPEAQMGHLKAAHAFEMGHRLNVLTVWPHRVDVSLPEILWFYWIGDFAFEPGVMAETLFTGKVNWEEK